VIVHLRDQDQPIRGYLVRENENTVVVAEVRPDGSTVERAILRSEIRELIRSVSDEQLSALRPENPAAYRAYAEDLAAQRADPDAQVTAIRLYLIAAHLDPQRLGPRCVLAMIPLARSAAEQRRFRAMAYLLDPAHDPAILQTLPTQSSEFAGLDLRQAHLLLRPLRALRQGNPRDALALARRYKLKERMALLGDSITYEEFEQACAPTCPHCTRGRQPCPDCQGAKFVTPSGAGRVACTTCGASGNVVCAACGGNYQSNPLSRALLERIVQLEMQWSGSPDDAANASRAARPAWSRTWQLGNLAPAPDLTLETLTEFDPRQCRYRDGRWEP
jgi:hypothetical protein